MPSSNEFGQSVINLQKDLQRKYQRDEEAITTTWQSLSTDQRKEVILAGIAGGSDGILLHRDDPRPELRQARFITPEINLQELIRDATLLSLLSQRAKQTPFESFYGEDAGFISYSIQNNGLSGQGRRNAFMCFYDREKYGDTMEVARNAPARVMENVLAMGKGATLREMEGRLILMRQSMLYSTLSIICDDVMEMKREIEDPGAEKRRPARRTADLAGATGGMRGLGLGNEKRSGAGTSKRGTEAAPSTAAADASKKKIGWQDVEHLAEEQLLSTQDHVDLMMENSLYFSMVANQYYFSNLEGVPDEKGAIAPEVMSGALATRAVLESLRDANLALNAWKVIQILLPEVSGKPKGTKAVGTASAELWSLCSKELLRLRMIFRRMASTDPKHTKYFVREKESGQVRFKDSPEVVARKNKFGSLVLQLATKTEISDVEAAVVLKDIEEYQELVPKVREMVSASMGEALADVSVMVVFMTWLRNLKIEIPKQTVSLFNKQMRQRVEEVEEVSGGLDLADYAFPLDNLKDPAAAKACIESVDRHFTNSKLGVGFGKAFLDTGADFVVELLGKIGEVEASAIGDKRDNIPFDPFIPSGTKEEAKSTGASGPSVKQKSRGIAAVENQFRATPSSSGPPQDHGKQKPLPTPRNALQTFKKLFRIDAPEKTGIPWAAFVAAMKGVGFKVETVGGSVSRFVPPPDGEGAADWKPINLHRPHPGDRIEGMTLVKIAGRLARRYG